MVYSLLMIVILTTYDIDFEADVYFMGIHLTETIPDING